MESLLIPQVCTPPIDDNLSPSKFLKHIFQNLESDVFELFCLICWAIWNDRNKLVHSNVVPKVWWLIRNGEGNLIFAKSDLREGCLDALSAEAMSLLIRLQSALAMSFSNLWNEYMILLVDFVAKDSDMLGCILFEHSFI